MKPKIFLISFHKAGTRSFHEFMVRHGYSSIHYPNYFDGREIQKEVAQIRDDAQAVVKHLAPVVAQADAHSDVPWPGLFPQLLTAYPEAKFVLGLRDPENWFDSVAHHWSLDFLARRLNPYEYCQYFPYLGSRAKGKFSKSDKSLLIRALLDHEDRVQKEIPGEKLFVFRLGDTGVGPRLAEFIGFKTSSDMGQAGSRKKSQLGRLKNNLLERIDNAWPLNRA